VKPAVRISGSGRISVDLIRLKTEIEAGKLTDRDRAIAEKLLPGICDLVIGKVKRLNLDGPVERG
jgi:hypothetical protein